MDQHITVCIMFIEMALCSGSIVTYGVCLGCVATEQGVRQR